ncbi:MAG: proline--tRNA ligase [Thermomicrobiales bacterium]|nr:proline--tRNA ligase [Thermomicrobiales bacterium]
MTDKKYVEDLIDQDDDFDQWYVDVIRKAELADDSPVRGCKVVRPYGWAIWENVQKALDWRIKEAGVENAAFPLFIPQSMLAQEADHIEGFAPEVAWVTRGGGKDLEEPWAVRPTSEAIICPMFAQWAQSYRDLPLMVNQWGNVVRWEDRPRAFLRTLEFYWQEGHTAHATLEEADARARQMLDAYRDMVETELAIPVVPGRKSEAEKFAGALHTYTIEAMMGGKHWALQSGTSHNLGDHFGKVYGIRFLDRDGERKFAFNTSWGLSHRVVGATIMVHGDDAGLKLPPRIAPIQVVIVPIWRKEGELTTVEEAVTRIVERLKPVARVKVDWRDDRTAGYKFNEWELKGVPVRLEIGPRDVAANQVVSVRRDTREKTPISIDELADRIPALLDTIQADMFEAAKRMLSEHTAVVDDYDTLAQRAADNAGWSLAHWCGDPACETKVKTETKATTRCIPFDQAEEAGSCVVCGGASSGRVIFARAY